MKIVEEIRKRCIENSDVFPVDREEDKRIGYIKSASEIEILRVRSTCSGCGEQYVPDSNLITLAEMANSIGHFDALITAYRHLCGREDVLSEQDELRELIGNLARVYWVGGVPHQGCVENIVRCEE